MSTDSRAARVGMGLGGVIGLGVILAVFTAVVWGLWQAVVWVVSTVGGVL